MEQIYHGRHVLNTIQSTKSRLQHLDEILHKNVVTRSTNQTIVSDVQFLHPMVMNTFKIDSVSKNFYLNDQSFENYANNCLTVDTDQVINSKKFIFSSGLTVNRLWVNNFNGIDLKKAILISANSVTQFVTGNHHFKHLELLNGTTAPMINDVRLIDVFQDTPFSVPLFHGQKHFHNLSLDHFFVDSLFNGIDFRKFLSEVVWLDNPSLSVQELNGSVEWNFLNLVNASSVSIANLINNHININYFVNFTAKRIDPMKTLIIEGIIYLENYAFINGNLHVNGLIDGLNLYEDVILLHGNQDFTKKVYSPNILHFEMPIRFQNLTTSLINSKFTTNDFLLKSNNPTFQLANQQGPAIYLTNKHFLNDLNVLFNVDVDEAVHFNGVDLSYLFKQLDSFVSFNTPLVVKEIIVGKQIFTNYFNQYPSSFVYQRLNNLWLRNVSQVIDIPFSYLNSVPISVRNLYFNSYRGFLEFPDHFVPNSGNINIALFAYKYFAKPIRANNIIIGPYGSVNGKRISQLYREMVHLGEISTSSTQIIDGRKTFQNIVIKGNLFVSSGAINNNFVSQIARTDAMSQSIVRNLHFETIKIESNRFTVNGNL